MSTYPEESIPETALVVGATGIAGSALIEHLLERGGTVHGLSRRSNPDRRAHEVLADLQDPQQLADALRDVRPTHVYYTSWVRKDTEKENCVANGAMVRNLLDALRPSGTVRHVALMTGLKHYLGPFEAYGEGDIPDTPFHEDEPRMPVDNFYYVQEDEVQAAALRDGFSWSVHRSHTVIGYAVGNAMNMGLTLAVYASLCKATGRRFIFPGSEAQWNGLTDMTDAGLLASHMVWASTEPRAANTAFNTVNGDVFRWRWMWPQLAAYFGVEHEGYSDQPRPLQQQMVGTEEIWASVVEEHKLTEPDLSRVASWWHTDGDLGRKMECLADMARSRRAGFTEQIPTIDALLQVFDRYRKERIIP